MKTLERRHTWLVHKFSQDSQMSAPPLNDADAELVKNRDAIAEIQSKYDAKMLRLESVSDIVGDTDLYKILYAAERDRRIKQVREGPTPNYEGYTIEEINENLKSTHPALDDCKVAECQWCAFIHCPFLDELHFHRDGCPSGCVSKNTSRTACCLQ